MPVKILDVSAKMTYTSPDYTFASSHGLELLNGLDSLELSGVGGCVLADVSLTYHAVRTT